MRPVTNMFAFLLSTLIAVGAATLLAPAACSSSNDKDDAGTNGDDNAIDAGDDDAGKTMVLKFGGLQSVDQQEAGLQLDLDAADDNTFGIAYFKQGTDSQSCSSEADCTDTAPSGSEWRCYSGSCTPVCT